jgi:hypothetical protein
MDGPRQGSTKKDKTKKDAVDKTVDTLAAAPPLVDPYSATLTGAIAGGVIGLFTGGPAGVIAGATLGARTAGGISAVLGLLRLSEITDSPEKDAAVKMLVAALIIGNSVGALRATGILNGLRASALVGVDRITKATQVGNAVTLGAYVFKNEQDKTKKDPKEKSTWQSTALNVGKAAGVGFLAFGGGGFSKNSFTSKGANAAVNSAASAGKGKLVKKLMNVGDTLFNKIPGPNSLKTILKSGTQTTLKGIISGNPIQTSLLGGLKSVGKSAGSILTSNQSVNKAGGFIYKSIDAAIDRFPQHAGKFYKVLKSTANLVGTAKGAVHKVGDVIKKPSISKAINTGASAYENYKKIRKIF